MRLSATVVQSLFVYPRFIDPWAGKSAAEAVVERFHEAGFTEFVFGWPSEDQVPVLENFAEDVMPRLRNLHAATPEP